MPRPPLTGAQYRQVWGDGQQAQPKAAAGISRGILDDLTRPHPNDRTVAAFIVPRPLVPMHATQPTATSADPFLSSRNLRKIEDLQAALSIEMRKRKELEELVQQLQPQPCL